MSLAAISCPKCQAEMVQGYVLDFTPVGGRVRRWNSGPPKRAGLNCILDSALQIPIGTFGCQSCGFLELYAREEFAAEGASKGVQPKRVRLRDGHVFILSHGYVADSVTVAPKLKR